MLVASLSDLKPIDYRNAFPNTSFPVTGPSDAFLSEMGYAKVNTFKPHTNTQKIVLSDPYIEDGWVYTVSVVDKTEEEIAAEAAAKIESAAQAVRAERNSLLNESDWTQLNDAPLNSLQKADWSEYRQALRDITKQTEFPWQVIWPNKPR